MTLQVTRTSPTVLTVTRRFTAPPARVWAAHMEPALIQQWLLGPDGWTMPTCINDPYPGGRIHYAWHNPADGSGFSVTGIYELVEAPHRSIHVEVMHMPDPTPENRVETRFDPDGTGTLFIMTMSVAQAATMDEMVTSGVTQGIETNCSRMERMVLGRA
jgi:uncharacterized protein YndB with AHSA1/START domain